MKTVSHGVEGDRTDADYRRDDENNRAIDGPI